MNDYNKLIIFMYNVPMLNIKGLTITQNDNEILSSININISKGDFVYLAGKSGSGKSTLFEYLSGVLEKTTKAKIKFTSKDISYNSCRLMLQNVPSQFFYFKVYDELKHSIGIRYTHSYKKRLLETAEKWGIFSLLNRNIYTLSSGEQQLLLLINMSIESPELLMLDEPTSFLDSNKSDIALRILKQYSKNGGTMIVSNHKSREMHDLAGKFYYLNNKKILLKNWPLSHDLNTEDFGLFPENHYKQNFNKKDPGEKLISIKDLEFSYNDEFLLKGINAVVHNGVWIQLSGPNGSGKSTILKLILGELKPRSGKIIRHKKINIQFLSQSYRYYTHKETLREEISCFDKEYSNRLVEKLRLQDVLDNDIFKLSCGEAKRSMILLALLNKPDILIVDEPESGLDYEILKIMMDMLSDLVNEGQLTIINVSHEKWLSEIYASTKWNIRDNIMEVYHH